MDESEISCIYYPTTIVVVDDNESVLENIELKIGKYLPCRLYSDPKEALAFIQAQMKRVDVLKNIIGIDEGSDYYNYASHQMPIQYDIAKIYNHVKNKDHFSELSVIVVDYAMPGMNGEELCKQLKRTKNHPLKIIMLTGEADEPTAIRLFNAGIIDRFMKKSDPDVDEQLKNAIISMQHRYFYDINYPLVRAISTDENSSLGDPVFREFFRKICDDISATSYYLIDTSGSFIFFNNSGKPTWLIIKTLNDLVEISDQIEAHISEEIIDLISKGEVIPYFWENEIEFFSDEEKLKKSLHKAKKLNGEKIYFYALLDELPEFPLETNKVVSFNQYMSQQ